MSAGPVRVPPALACRDRRERAPCRDCEDELAVRHLARHPAILERLAAAADRILVRLRPGPAPVAGFLAQLRVVRPRPLHVAGAGAYAIANWLLDALCLGMCCLAVGATTVTTVQLLITYCAGMAAASMLPIVPGGLGVIDSALVLGLVTSGIPSSAAIAAVLLYRLISLGFIVGTGWAVWLVLRYRNRPTPAAAESARAGCHRHRDS